MIHRYSFDSDASDLIGDAHGQLVGDAAIQDGAVVLSGRKPSYVDLPNDLVAELESVTLELWVAWNGGAAWQRILDFGNSGGEGLQTAASKSLFLTPDNGGGMQLSLFPSAGQFGQQVLNAPRLGIGQLHQIAWTLDAATQTSRLYVDGAQVSILENSPFTLVTLGSTVNNWIGHSQYIQDADFNGSVAEFRIYDGALTADAVGASYRTGPDPAGRGPLLSVSLVAKPAMRPGASQQVQVRADFQNVLNLDVTAEAGVSYEVSNPAVLTISASGLLTSSSAEMGKASLTARYEGKASSVEVEVVSAPPAVMVHRYSFDADAADVLNGADGELIGDAAIENGAVVLSGNKPSYVNLPNDLFAELDSASFEIWVVWNGGPQWQRIWDFGNSSGEDISTGASKSIFLTPDNGGGLQFSIFPSTAVFGQQVLNAPRLGVGNLHHLVWTYDDLATTGILYLDGSPIALNANMTAKPSDLGSTVNNWLGHSQYSQDADFSGSIAEFRIYQGTMKPEEVATNSLVGPDPSGRGLLVDIQLVVRSPMLRGDRQQLQVKGNFEKVSGVDLTGDPGLSFSISNPDAAAVSSVGWLTADPQANTTVRVTATYQGKTAGQDVEIVSPVAPVLRHRYRFDSDAADSVGGLDGTLVGDAAVEGGSVVLSGVKPSYVDFPNELVDGLTDVTIELWLTWNGGPIWQRIIDFGNNTGGEGNQGVATQSLFLTPNNGGVMDLSIFPNGIGGQQVINGPPLTPQVPHHLVWTYSHATTTSKLFVDGGLNGLNNAMTYSLADLAPLSNLWLGHSQYTQDSDLAATIAEFRIYSGTFEPVNVLASLEAGPDFLPDELATRRLGVEYSGGSVVISWPVSGAGLKLVAATVLGPGANWVPVNTPPIVQNSRNHVSLPPTSSAQFFRLEP